MGAKEVDLFRRRHKVLISISKESINVTVMVTLSENLRKHCIFGELLQISFSFSLVESSKFYLSWEIKIEKGEKVVHLQ